ncbi:toxic anion resistance protein [Clostridium sp. 19966]|uniref:toxic anion resistance protein n=1 Tax=Clostridium sp. 19966 TaxID=2768166 RepID=UPI0028DEF279|nr:toxic anion resistance protein [Clostridium sp. 19966]MDT8716172.1 toxic anion resistance protein [Clostridium sp. 19966]
MANNEILEVKEENIEVRANDYKQQLAKSPEVLQIASTIDARNATAILEYGNQPAQEISKFADQILRTIKSSTLEDSSVMIKELTSIMKKFDKQDFEDKPQGFFGKVFNKPAKAVEKIMGKYKTVGSEIDRIYTQLGKYKGDINNANVMLDNMYDQNFNYYQELEKYITAGNLAAQKLENDDIPALQAKAENSGDQMDYVNVENAKTALEMFKQRLYDLETAKMVALQTAPQIKMIQRGNYKLIAKIHSAFIITIPVFKSGIVQAVALKRQQVVSDSLTELDRTTNELLLKNAQNIKNQSIDIAKLTGGPSVKIETLEKTWSTIMEGIEETRRIEEENKQLREQGLIKLDDMTQKLKKKSLNP